MWSLPAAPAAPLPSVASTPVLHTLFQNLQNACTRYRVVVTSARHRVASLWEDYTTAWLRGETQMPLRLKRWYDSYSGVGDDATTSEGMAEPYIGSLLADPPPRMAVLGLNPGAYVPAFQARDGIFAKEIGRYGSYRAWASSGPYHRPPWTDEHGPNRFHRSRLAFTRAWLQDADADHSDLLIVVCYPWHSPKITAKFAPPIELIEEYVWQPLAELPVGEIFAFGRPWNHIASALGLRPLQMLGAGGDGYGSRVASRAVRTYGLESGQRLVVEWHTGRAGPPGAAETEILRKALQ